MPERRKPKYDGPLEEISPERSDPMRRLSNDDLQRFIREQQSLERAINDNPAHTGTIAKIRREIQKAEIILEGRRDK